MLNQKKDLLEKAAIIKIFHYFSLGSELKKQTSITENQYKRSDQAFISNKDNKNVNESLIKKESISKKKYHKENLVYKNHSSYSYGENKEFASLSFKSRYSYLLNSYDYLENLIKTKNKKKDKRKRKSVQYSM